MLPNAGATLTVGSPGSLDVATTGSPTPSLTLGAPLPSGLSLTDHGDGTATIATRLKGMGFATGAFIGAFPLTKRFGLTLGFDKYDDQIVEMRGAWPASSVRGAAMARSSSMRVVTRG